MTNDLAQRIMEIRSRVSFPLLPASTIRMNKAIAILLLAFGVACFAKTAPDPKPQLIAMLNNFLAAASHTPASATDKAVFDQFFADDVIYTRAAGLVITKADIMRSLDEPPSPSNPVATYSAEDVTFHDYGNVAVVAFRLVQKLSDRSTKQFRNTGTFVNRNHKWQVVAWQATAIPSGGESEKK